MLNMPLLDCSVAQAACDWQICVLVKWTYLRTLDGLILSIFTLVSLHCNSVKDKQNLVILLNANKYYDTIT